MSDFSSTSGVGRTYRYLNTSASPPLFEFGHGLSYSKFLYSNLTVEPAPNAATNSRGSVEGGPVTFGRVTRKGASDPDGPAVSVSVSVENVGQVAAHEVVQVSPDF